MIIRWEKKPFSLIDFVPNIGLVPDLTQSSEVKGRRMLHLKIQLVRTQCQLERTTVKLK